MNSKPKDSFERYFTEKLWEMIPAVYRHEDGLARNPGVLRAFIEILADQAAHIRRSHDRLWEDQYIELCDDWVVPYLADLVGTRLVSALNLRGRRVDVAKTIYYRRRKGTPRVLEELISDIAGWEGKVVENRRRLARTRHGLDPYPVPFAGPFTTNLPGGWAGLRSLRSGELAHGPFDEFHYTPDFRRHRGIQGRYAIPKVAFHLYRLPSFKVAGVTPRSVAQGKGFTFDPSGRDVPLFMPRGRAGNEQAWGEWTSAREWDLPGPIPCRLLAHAEFEINEENLADLFTESVIDQAQVNQLRQLKHVRLRSEQNFQRAVRQWASSVDTSSESLQWRAVLARTLVQECGRNKLVPEAVEVNAPGIESRPELMVAANLENWTASAPGKDLAVDPERGRFRLLKALSVDSKDISVTYNHGSPGSIGAGTYDRGHVDTVAAASVIAGGGDIIPAGVPRDGVLQINDSRTYRLAGAIQGIVDLTFRAANHERPYLRFENSLILDTDYGDLKNEDSLLTIDGVWFGGSSKVILSGDYELVAIRHTTLDPGGADADGQEIPEVNLIITGHIEKLVIDRSVTGPIGTKENGVVERLMIRDSIVQAADDDAWAIALDAADLDMKNVTVFGRMKVHRLTKASEILATGKVEVSDAQSGCFRFSAAPEDSLLPRPYRWFPIPLNGQHQYFLSRRFGEPAYARLSQLAPAEIREGAESGSEIGAFCDDITAVKMQGLYDKVVEFLPFGLIPIFVRQT